MTSFLQLNIDLKASWRLNCSHLHEEGWGGGVCVGTCCVLIRCEFFLLLFFAPLTFTAADSSNLSSWGYRTFSHPATSVIKHDNRLMMIPAAQSHDRTLALFMMSFCNLSSLSNAFFFLSSPWCLHLNATAQFHLFQRHDGWQSFVSVHWRTCWRRSWCLPELWEKRVCDSPGWIIPNICWADGDS